MKNIFSGVTLTCLLLASSLVACTDSKKVAQEKYDKELSEFENNCRSNVDTLIRMKKVRGMDYFDLITSSTCDNAQIYRKRDDIYLCGFYWAINSHDANARGYNFCIENNPYKP
jgi:hypothetical protein